MKNLNGITNVSYVHNGDDVNVRIERTGPKDPEEDPGLEIARVPEESSREEDSPISRDLTSEEKEEKKRILKNIVVISFAFFFLFTSYNGMNNLQSSLNNTDGTASLTTLYVAYIISCCLLPSWVLQLLQEKKTMIICMLFYSWYITAQFYPRLYTLLPTAIINGLVAAPLWSAKCTYLTKVSSRYGYLAGERSDVIVTKFFGIFFLFFQATQIFGNLITSLVLSIGVETSETSIDEEALSKCGYHFCIAETIQTTTNANDTIASSMDGPPLWQIYTMATIFLFFTLLSALIIFLFLDPLSSFPKVQDSDNGQSTLQLLTATFVHMRHPYQLLIIPLTVWSGMEQGFLSTDFTAAYVSCGIGVHNVGYIMICYGACGSVCSLGFSFLVKKMGRVPLFTLAFVINLAVIITLMRWRPHPDDLVWFFVISGIWGVADAVWQTQINSLYGIIFPGKSASAFSNYRLWESVGFFISYMFSTILCIDDKITMLFVVLIPGMTFYYVIEFIEKRGYLKRDTDGTVIPIDKLFTGKS